MTHFVLRDLNDTGIGDRDILVINNDVVGFEAYAIVLIHPICGHVCGYLNIDPDMYNALNPSRLRDFGVNFFSIGSPTLTIKNSIIDVIQVPMRDSWIGFDYAEYRSLGIEEAREALTHLHRYIYLEAKSA